MSCQTSQEQRESLLRLQATLHEELAQERSLQLDAKRLLQEKEVCKLLQKQVSHAGVHGTALECCRPASKRLTVAVAAALGPKASSLLVDSHALALKCIEYLKTARLGSCEFLPIETLRQKQLRGGGEDTEEEEGGTLLPPPPADALPPGCRWAVDCVSFEDRFRHVYQFLLSDCLIVPSLAVARELRFGRAHASVEKYRLVTLDGEKLQRGGVIAFDLGGLTGRLAARWEAQQQDRLLERVEKVREQLQALEHAETTTAERLQQRTAQFNLLHRQCVQLQAKARVWEEQAEEKQEKLHRMQTQLQELREREAARKQELTAKQQALDEIHATVLQQQQRHFAQLDAAVGRRHVLAEHRRRRQRVEALKAELTGLHAQETQLQAELADCGDRLAQLQRSTEAKGEEDEKEKKEDERRLLKQLELTERDVEDADSKREAAAAEARDAQQDLQTHEKNLQKIRERVEASKLEQQRLSREAAAASGRQRQQTMESMQILRQADQQGMRVPLAAGTWRNVRMWVYREEKRRAFLDSSSEDEEPQSVDAPSEERGHSKKSKDAAESPRRTGDIAGRRRSDASERDAPEGEGTGEGEVRDRRREQERPDEDEKLFVIDFSKLAAEKREFISQHKDTPARLLEAAATQEAELLRRGAHLRSLFPNLKVGEKEKKTREQLTEISAELERVQRVSRAAAARLADLQRERNARFAVCFHHCRVAVDVFFRELTTTTFGKDAGLDDATSGFAKVGGRAYLDLERPRGDREDDAFAG
ncbi:RecF/RecN/SMC N terminal domain-containing protein [Toxoplasma gondii VAND]|uniref:RecF/RecN/SMC N terminal domain-containing protein n=1 Tax=Toxoplasma gondii VAND TaxID=933077 RepID=A0A086Q8A2_TOXGO|nr:RecF/RecN/SMC N terminal domain-containing protein [Toxoplasma gondii VAND]